MTKINVYAYLLLELFTTIISDATGDHESLPDAYLWL